MVDFGDMRISESLNSQDAHQAPRLQVVHTLKAH